MRDKLTSMTDAIAVVGDNQTIALGGNTLHRGPAAAVHELIRQGRRGLEIVKTAGAYDVDLLCGMGVASSVSAGFIGFETGYGLAPSYRRGVERGTVEAREHACYTVIAGLRAAIQGIPFMPVAGMTGSDVPAARGFRSVVDPYSGRSVVAAPAIMPDVAIVHVQESDRQGNARIIGTRFEDVLMAQAARRVIITAERIVDGATFEAMPEVVAIPGFMVEMVVEAPRGAWPCSCAGAYEQDDAFLAEYVAASQDADRLHAFVRDRVLTHDLVPV